MRRASIPPPILTSTPPSGVATVVAVAPSDPLSPRAFSGYSSRLFNGMRARGVGVLPFASRDMRWYDVASGAVNVSGLARGRLFGRRAPRVRPNWYWSRTGFERFSARLAARLRGIPSGAALLQVGTHVRLAVQGSDAYCVTDCTVVQALEGGEFSISQASPRIAREAIACQREVFEACRKVFTLSSWAATSVINDYGVPPERVVVVGAGANVSMPLERRIDCNNPYVLFVGVDWEQKGGPLLLDAVRLLRRERPDVVLKVVGCTPPVQDPAVNVVGYLPPSDPAARQRLGELYAGAACFALLSRFDCFPNVLLEAQLAGVPVVTLNGQGRAEELLDGETGLLVERADPVLVARALLTLVTRETSGGVHGRAAHRWAEKRFTWPLVVDRMLTEMGIEVSETPERLAPSA